MTYFAKEAEKKITMVSGLLLLNKILGQSMDCHKRSFVLVLAFSCPIWTAGSTFKSRPDIRRTQSKVNLDLDPKFGANMLLGKPSNVYVARLYTSK